MKWLVLNFFSRKLLWSSSVAIFTNLLIMDILNRERTGKVIESEELTSKETAGEEIASKKVEGKEITI